MAGHDHCHSSHHYWGGEAGNLCHYQGTVNVKKQITGGGGCSHGSHCGYWGSIAIVMVIITGGGGSSHYHHGHWEWWLGSTVMGLDKLMGCLPVVALMVLSSCHG